VPKIRAATIEEHRAATIDQLLDAFGALVLDRGYEAVNFADVASRAGLARTAVYNYFPDRETMLIAWTDREVRRAIEGLQQQVADAEPGEEQLKIFVARQIADFASRHLPPGQEVIRFLNPETYERFMGHLEPLREIVHQIVIDGMQAGAFGEGDPDSLIPMVMACIGAQRGPVAKGDIGPEAATEQVMDFLRRALVREGS
jgi:AcrR family transcriptional regulator